MNLKPAIQTRFRKDNSGSTATVFAISVVPVLGLAGAAIDYSNAVRIQSALQRSADAAVVAGLKGGKNLGERKKIAERFVRSEAEKLPVEVKLLDVSYSDLPDGGRVAVNAKMKTYLVGSVLDWASTDGGWWMKLGLDAEAKVGGSTGKSVEIALVLDNTGSMRNDMPALRSSARMLVNEVMPATPDNVKIAVVPYVGAVNPGRANLPMEMMDTNADSKWHAQRLEEKRTLKIIGCEPGFSPGGGSNPLPPKGGGGSAGGNDRNSDAGGALHHLWNELFGVRDAFAQAPVPSGWSSDKCYAYTPKKLNHFDLFERIPNVQWKGCVEARPEPYDVLDTVPSRAATDTLFVPYFWPDEPDKGINDFVYPNNYLPDPMPPLTGWQYDGSQADGDNGRTTFVLKYDGRPNAAIDEVPPATKGPNAACPDEVLPLTSKRDAVLSKIDGLSHWEGSGTISSEGLMWGWRALSPEAPFSEGAPYDKVEKHIVIFTDGFNAAAEQEFHGSTATDYTAYGYLRNENGRLGMAPNWSESYKGYKQYVDGRTREACKNIRAKGIIIHAVTFKVTDADTEKLFKDCVSQPSNYYVSSSETELKKAFAAISESIRGEKSIYISR